MSDTVLQMTSFTLILAMFLYLKSAWYPHGLINFDDGFPHILSSLVLSVKII